MLFPRWSSTWHHSAEKNCLAGQDVLAKFWSWHWASGGGQCQRKNVRIHCLLCNPCGCSQFACCPVHAHRYPDTEEPMRNISAQHLVSPSVSAQHGGIACAAIHAVVPWGLAALAEETNREAGGLTSGVSPEAPGPNQDHPGVLSATRCCSIDRHCLCMPDCFQPNFRNRI